MVQARIQGDNTMVITGLPGASRGTIREWMEDVAQLVEERIAADFEREVAAGRKLAGNSAAYNERKAVEGLDERRGHATGNLQNELDAGGFYRVGIMGGGRATIVWRESALTNRVVYAGYYAEAKVRGGKILVLLPKDVQAAESYLRSVIAGWQRRAA